MRHLPEQRQGHPEGRTGSASVRYRRVYVASDRPQPILQNDERPSSPVALMFPLVGTARGEGSEHSHAERRKGEKRGDFARFYFMAVRYKAFRWAWGYSGRTRFRHQGEEGVGGCRDTLRAKVLKASESIRSLIHVMSYSFPAIDAVRLQDGGPRCSFATVYGGLPAENYARELLEAVPAAVFATDAVGRIVFYNQPRRSLGHSTGVGEN